jgi:exonuclease VII large subunit
MQKEVQQMAQRIRNYRSEAPERMHQALSKQTADLGQVQAMMEQITKKKSATEENKENERNIIDDILVDSTFYQNSWRLSKSLLEEQLPDTQKKILDASQALKTIDTNKRLLNESNASSLDTPMAKKRKL